MPRRTFVVRTQGPSVRLQSPGQARGSGSAHSPAAVSEAATAEITNSLPAVNATPCFQGRAAAAPSMHRAAQKKSCQKFMSS
ncbi:hypothetical protein JOB18_048476 [Solea senegalensis]|uniref:Uncharacterized protein n=1 Tax=Solea senegalensis TaxID=28829 RepID=A0AAV6QJ59_SOLSE|nr:hypothetical protein JOB18_048476 [Solea senegalensis]